MSAKESWGSRIGLILAMAGNAVGLGNFLRFPVQAVNNGGGAFLIPYLVCFFLMGIPLLWIEWASGRFGGRFGNHSTPFILDNMTRSSFWKYFGVFGIFTNIGVAAYYCYIESWTMSYVFHSLMLTFKGMSQSEVAAFFNDYVDISSSTTGIPYEAVIFYVICLALNTFILSQGLSGGVERAAKIGMPLLLAFGTILAIRAVTLGSSGAPAGCTDCDAILGMNYLWEPQFDSLANPKVWLAAAGQIFFTLSVGMGTIQCYAAYVRSKDDIALNAMSAGWMNGFVEIVLGASIVIPIAVGYLGLDWVKQNAGFAMAFQTMPYLFAQWGDFFGAMAGLMWFGLLFFAGITSSLAMGTPWMGFMADEFGWDRKRGAWSFGLITLIFGLPTVIFFQEGVFGEYDYWAGTVSLVVFALAETILFTWVWGMDKGWEEINMGADIQIPYFFKYIIKYATPTLLLLVFLSSLVTPKNGDWERALKGDWELDPGSIIGKITNSGFVANRRYFAPHFESEVNGTVTQVSTADPAKQTIQITDADGRQTVYTFGADKAVAVAEGKIIRVGDIIAKGEFVNQIFYTDLSKGLLLLLFGIVSALVYLATRKRAREGILT